MSVTTAQAISLLENVLFESKTLATANAAGWVSLSNLNSSYSTVAGLAGAMAQTAEATIAQQVIRYYEGALGRAPSGAEVAYYVNIVENGNSAAGIPAMTSAQINTGASAVPAGTWDKIASFFSASPEFAFASAGGNVVNLLYLNILGRAPNAAEIAYYQNLLNGGTTVSTLVQYFTTSPEYQGKVNGQIQANITTYGTTVTNGGTAPASIGPITNIVPTVVTLTTGLDTITGASNITINGTDSTANGLDSIVLSGGGNTLNLSDVAGGAIAFAGLGTISGVQTLNYTSSKALSGAAVDVSGWSGLTSANFQLNSIKADQAVTAAGTTALKVTGTVATASNINTTGGSTVTVSLADAVTNAGSKITVTGTAGATTAVSVTQSGIAAGGAAVLINDPNQGDGKFDSTIATVTLDGLTGAASTIKSDALTSLTVANSSQNVTVTAAATTGTATRALAVTVNNDTAGTIADATANSVSVTSTGKASSGITVSAAAATSATLGGTVLDTLTLTAANVTTLTITGSGGVTLTDTLAAKAAINASTSTGTNTLSLGAAQTYTGGTGASVITVGADVTVAVAAGSGTADELVLGFDASTLSKTYANATGFELIGVGAGSKGTIDLSKFATTITGVEVDAAVAAAVVFNNAAAGTTLTLKAAPTFGVTYALAKDTSADSLNLVLNTTSKTAAGIDFSGKTVDIGAIESVTITSNGNETAANKLALTDAAATTLKIAGTNDLTLTGLAGNTVTSIDATGIGKGIALDVSGITLGTKGVTFTGGDGNYTFKDAGLLATFGDTITAGNGNDSITISSATNSASTITLGNGNDTVNVGASTGNNTITVGTGADTITVGAGNNSVTLGAHSVGTVDTVIFAAPGANANVYTTVTGWATKGDVLSFAAGAAATLTLGVDVTSSLNASTAVFQDYVNTAASHGGGVAGQVDWFTFGGNTYAVVNENGAEASFDNGVDFIVKLTGTADVAHATITGATLIHG